MTAAISSQVSAFRNDGWAGVPKRVLLACIMTLAFVLSFAIPAFAYQEDLSQPARGCPDCHGLESGATSPTVAPRTGLASEPESGTNVGTRKGPHGGYTSGTQKCETCHTIHGANQFGTALLPEPTISSTCYTCHDGTGGGGVYGVIKQRTGTDPAQVVNGKTQGGVHRIGWLNASSKVTVPGGKADGSSIDTTFTGENGALTCTDCHSPHNAKTVAAFIGDRKRSTNDTTSALSTNRLLKQRPTSSTTTVTAYGSDWCETCHKGRHSQASTMGNHPAADSVTAPGWTYSKVVKMTAYGASTTTSGALGGDNLGYVMPEPRGAQPYPICQQCHEDARNVGDATQFRVSVSESFTASVDGSPTTGNPRFTNFPHESAQDTFLIESYDDLCLNCHVAP